MAIIQIIHLTQKTYRVPPIAYMVQGDTGRELRMVIDDIELTGNPTAELSFMRADQSFYSVNAEFESQTNSFVADVTQAITQAGTTKAQLKVTSSSKVVSSYTFLIFVEPNTDGLPTEQMGWPLEDIMNAVNELMYGALGLSDDVKEALLDCFAHVAWINDQGQTYYDALEEALYPPVPVSSVTVTPSTFQLSSIGATQQLTATVAPSSAQATVTWSSSDTSVATVSESGLVTSVAVGTATITASAGGVDGTAACTVALPTLSSISAVYTQSGTVYDTDSLDSLKDDLVVTATWSDSSTTTVPSTDYTLSGTLTEGTSTITVSYGGKTDTFTVTVSVLTPLYPLATGTYPFMINGVSGSYLEISNVNHVKLYFAVTTTAQYFANLHTGDVGNSSIVNNKSEWFVIPANKEAVLTISNVINLSDYNVTLNFRKTNASTSSSFSTGDNNKGGKTVTQTLSTAESVSSLFAYVANITAGSTLEFDVRFTVDGELYI